MDICRKVSNYIRVSACDTGMFLWQSLKIQSAVKLTTQRAIKLNGGNLLLHRNALNYFSCAYFHSAVYLTQPSQNCVRRKSVLIQFYSLLCDKSNFQRVEFHQKIFSRYVSETFPFKRKNPKSTLCSLTNSTQSNVTVHTLPGWFCTSGLFALR